MVGRPTSCAGWSAASALLAVVAAAPASAQQAPEPSSSPIAVDWRAPGNCPDGAHVLRGIHRLLGGVPAPGVRALQVRGRVEAGGFGFALDLETEDEKRQQGRRTLTASTCEALADAAALVVALGWDPAAVAATRARPPPAPPVTGPPLSPPPPPGPTEPRDPTQRPAAPPPSAPPSRPPSDPGAGGPRPSKPVLPPSSIEVDRFAVGAGLVLDVGGLPGVSAGFGGWVGLLLGAYRIEVQGTGFPSSEAQVEDGTAGGRFVQVLGSAHLCRTLAPWDGPQAGNELAACLGMEGGATFAEGADVDAPEQATVGWAAPRTGLQGRLEIAGGLGARLDVGLAVPLVRRPFVLDRLGDVHQPAPVAGRFTAGLDLRF